MEKRKLLKWRAGMQSPNKKKKRKINKVNLWALIISGIAILGLICVAIHLSVYLCLWYEGCD